jgi:hypothetical protein
MPKIPRYTDESTIPAASGGVRVNPQAFGAVWGAMAGVGEGVSKLGELGLAMQKAETAVKATTYENQLRNDFEDLAQSYKMRTDYDKFETDARKQVDELSKKYQVNIGDNERLGNIFKPVLEDKTREFLRTVRDKKITEMTKQGNDEFNVFVNRSISDYGVNPTPENKELLRKTIENRANLLIEGHTLREEQKHAALLKFGPEADKAYIMSLNNLGQSDLAVQALSDPEVLKDLDPTDRQQLLHQSMIRAHQDRTLKKEEAREIQEQNSSKIVDSMVKASVNNKMFSFKDLDSMLKGLGHDPANGKFAISASEEMTLKNNIQARMDHYEVTGRRQPDMDEAKWATFGKILDGIPDGTTTYNDISAQANKLPDHLIGNLMNAMGSIGKGAQNASMQTCLNYVSGFKVMFGQKSFGELKNEVVQMMNSGEFKPDQWFVQTQKIVNQKGLSSGNIGEKLKENLQPFTPATQAKPTVPLKQDWMVKAKQANPKATDQELEAYYKQKYEQ